MTAPHLRLVVCGAGPASDAADLLTIAHSRRWTTEVVATPSAAPFMDLLAVEALTGRQVRTDYQRPALPTGRQPAVIDAVLIAPATYNTINKLAYGIADTYALASTAELIGRGIPTVLVPFVNSALAARAPFRRSVDLLRGEGVRMVLGPNDDWEPHPPGTGATHQARFPWDRAFTVVATMILG